MPLSEKTGMMSPNVTNNSSSARPEITSGKIIGAVINNKNALSPWNLCTLTITKAAKVPIITEAIADIKAMVSEIPTAVIIAELLNNALYHFKENCVHTVTIFDSLNEYTIRVMIGKYKNVSAKARMITLIIRLLVCFFNIILVVSLLTLSFKEPNNRYSHDC